MTIGGLPHPETNLELVFVTHLSFKRPWRWTGDLTVTETSAITNSVKALKKFTDEWMVHSFIHSFIHSFMSWCLWRSTCWWTFWCSLQSSVRYRRWSATQIAREPSSRKFATPSNSIVTPGTDTFPVRHSSAVHSVARDSCSPAVQWHDHPEFSRKSDEYVNTRSEIGWI